MRHDDSVLVSSSDLRHKLIRSSGKRECSTIVAFALPVTVQADHENGDISFRGELRRILHLLIGLDDRGAADPYSRARVHENLIFITIGRSADIDKVNVDIMRNACLGLEDRFLFECASREEGFSTTLASPVVDKKLAIDIELKSYENNAPP